MLRLYGGVQHYAWGDPDFIPALLGIENRQRRPYAELWLGAHPDLPAKADVAGALVPLHTLLDQSAERILGPEVCRALGRQLPYLLKVLSARAPLSIQVHPSKQNAQLGFAREDAAGVPRQAPQRNYRDQNHKPELLVALADFYALRGFRPLPEIAQMLSAVPEYRCLMPIFEPTSHGLTVLYQHFMNLPQPQVDAILDPLLRRLRAEHQQHRFTRSDREHWVLKADQETTHLGHRDRGLFSIFLLNLVGLKPGEALFQPAGVLHTYLVGSGIEIMANSNNVLRGGLTTKHVDVKELLANVEFVPQHVEILRAVPIPGSREWVYPAPVDEFELRRVEIADRQPHVSRADRSAELLVLISAADRARVTVTAEGKTLDLRQGGALLAPYGTSFTVHATAPATLYKALVPVGPQASSYR
ncbi:MAG: mannose-6-phosphate isomerase, class I [Planctomycetes bacterium RBG_16_64_10]|nr:MAG: mannose-6-phosphate isomerase, class I [Planctomycetes bacterium RBG_16_64_10]